MGNILFESLQHSLKDSVHKISLAHEEEPFGDLVFSFYSPYAEARGATLISPLKGNDHVVYLHSSWAVKHTGREKHELLLSLLKEAGVKTVLCTVNNTNWPEIKIMMVNDWKAISKLSDYSWLWIKELN